MRGVYYAESVRQWTPLANTFSVGTKTFFIPRVATTLGETMRRVYYAESVRQWTPLANTFSVGTKTFLIPGLPQPWAEISQRLRRSDQDHHHIYGRLPQVGDGGSLVERSMGRSLSIRIAS